MTSASSSLLPPGSSPLPEPKYFRASDGYQLGYRLWTPSGTPRALVVLLHGIQSHSGWYGDSSSALAESGYVIAYLDRRGSGVNQRNRGDAPHHERLINDVVQFVQHLSRCDASGLPRILGAVSWGGKLAAAVTMQRPELVDALLLVTPGICAHVRATAIQNAALRIANAIDAQQRLVPIPLNDPTLFTSSPTHQQFIREDPLTLRNVTLRFLAANSALDRLLRQGQGNIKCPTMVMLSQNDKIVDNVATRDFLPSICRSDPTFTEYPDAVHTLEFEPDRSRYISDMLNWLNAVS